MQIIREIRERYSEVLTTVQVVTTRSKALDGIWLIRVSFPDPFNPHLLLVSRDAATAYNYTPPFTCSPPSLDEFSAPVAPVASGVARDG